MHSLSHTHTHTHTHIHTHRRHHTSSPSVSISHRESSDKEMKLIFHQARPFQNTTLSHLSKQFLKGLNRYSEMSGSAEMQLVSFQGLVQITSNWPGSVSVPESELYTHWHNRKCHSHVSGTQCLMAGWTLLECKLSAHRHHNRQRCRTNRRAAWCYQQEQRTKTICAFKILVQEDLPL